MVFIDTNVLVYAASGLARDEAKTRAARNLLGSPADIAISVQVLNEFYHVARSPKKHGQDYGGIVVENPFLNL